jgi:hypothetical protein
VKAQGPAVSVRTCRPLGYQTWVQRKQTTRGQGQLHATCGRTRRTWLRYRSPPGALDLLQMMLLLLLRESECQVGLDDGREVAGPDHSTVASKVDYRPVSRVEGASAAGVSTILDLKRVLPWLYRHLDRAVHVDRADVFAIEQDAKRAPSKLHNDASFSDQVQGGRHVRCPFSRGPMWADCQLAVTLSQRPVSLFVLVPVVDL